MLFFAILPVGLGSIFTGTLVDIWNRRIVMLIGNAVASLSTLVAALLFFGDVRWKSGTCIIVLIVNGLANAFVMSVDGSQRAATGGQARESWTGIRASTQMVHCLLEVIISPAMAGFLVVSAGLGVHLHNADFVTFGASVVALASVGRSRSRSR